MRHYISPTVSWTEFPADVVVVVAYALVAAPAVAFLEGGTALRVLVAAPLLGFLPGHLLVAAAFPATAGADRARGFVGSRVRDGAVTTGERLALSIGASVVVLVLLAVALAAVPAGYTEPRALAALTGLVVVLGVVAGVRRLQVPAEDRYRVPVWRWYVSARAALFETESRLDAAVNLALAVSVVVAVSTLAYGLAAPPDGEAYTGFAVLTENESGDLVAGGFPEEVAAGGNLTLTLAVENREDRRTNYTIVAELQRVRADGSTVTVLDERELHREAVTVAAGETWRGQRTLRPALAGEDLRLALYLYRGDAPADAGPDSAYRRLTLWLTVTDPAANATATVGPADRPTPPVETG